MRVGGLFLCGGWTAGQLYIAELAGVIAAPHKMPPAGRGALAHDTLDQVVQLQLVAPIDQRIEKAWPVLFVDIQALHRAADDSQVATLREPATHLFFIGKCALVLLPSGDARLLFLCRRDGSDAVAQQFKGGIERGVHSWESVLGKADLFRW